MPYIINQTAVLVIDGVVSKIGNRNCLPGVKIGLKGHILL